MDYVPCMDKRTTGDDDSLASHKQGSLAKNLVVDPGCRCSSSNEYK